MSCNFDSQQLTKLEKVIAAYMDALLFFALSNGVEEYTLNTGQGSQRVKRSDVNQMETTMARLTIQRDVFYSRVYGTGAVQITPGTAPIR